MMALEGIGAAPAINAEEPRAAIAEYEHIEEETAPPTDGAAHHLDVTD